jgi:hypothetical protein
VANQGAVNGRSQSVDRPPNNEIVKEQPKPRRFFKEAQIFGERSQRFFRFVTNASNLAHMRFCEYFFHAARARGAPPIRCFSLWQQYLRSCGQPAGEKSVNRPATLKTNVSIDLPWRYV